MNISGYQKLTLLDYPGKLAAIVFTLGCNFRCKFCHNKEFVLPELAARQKLILEEEVLAHLKRRKGLIDGVVITGGEPTMQKDLKDFILKIREMGFLIKLDTNGSDFEVLKNLIKENLLDFVAMDIKGIWDDYGEITEYSKIDDMKKSVSLIMDCGIDYEFRTTLLPKYHAFDKMKLVGEQIRGAKKYCLQKFRSERTLDDSFVYEESFTDVQMEKIKELMEQYVEEVEVRT